MEQIVRMTDVKTTEEQLVFAKAAAACFATFPDKSTFGDIAPGALLALRWGMQDDCVLIIKQSEYFQAVNFQQIIKGAI